MSHSTVLIKRMAYDRAFVWAPSALVFELLSLEIVPITALEGAGLLVPLVFGGAAGDKRDEVTRDFFRMGGPNPGMTIPHCLAKTHCTSCTSRAFDPRWLAIRKDCFVTLSKKSSAKWRSCSSASADIV